MTLPRYIHTATRLLDGKILILGGFNNDIGHPVNTAELFDPISQTFASLWPITMVSPRDGHTATLLQTGQVLITGGYSSNYLNSAEIFDPISGEFQALPLMASARWEHTATLLHDGTVLILGGRDAASGLDTAELFDPITGAFVLLPSMTSRRFAHTATLLSDGKVLIAGGSTWSGVGPDTITDTAEMFDPVSQTFTSLSPRTMTWRRDGHSATLLPNGKVLIAAGYDGSGRLETAEIFDPVLETFTILPTMRSPRAHHTAILLANGKVLIAGGYAASAESNTAELYDPQFVSFTLLPLMNSPRWLHAAALLETGKVLLTGGASALPIEDLFDPGGIMISGTILYCSDTSSQPIADVTVNLTGSATGGTVSGGSGNYTLNGLTSGGSYIVTPTKTPLGAGTNGINTVDVLAIQGHLLRITTLPPGCRLRAADVTNDDIVDTIDVVAVQRFSLALTIGVANTGRYRFSPMSREYVTLTGDQTDQGYDAVVLGDVAAPFVEP